METLSEERKVPRSAADVEDVAARLDVRLVDELPVRRLTPDQPGEDVIQRKQPVVVRCRNVGPLSLSCVSAHGHFLAVNRAYLNRRRLACRGLLLDLRALIVLSPVRKRPRISSGSGK